VTRAATRSRWLEVTRSRVSARRGRDLLDEKREVLVREVLGARRRRDAALEDASGRRREAAARLAEAEVEIGVDAVESAALAQGPAGGVSVSRRAVLGVALPSLTDEIGPLRIFYSPGGTSASLDAAAAAHHALAKSLVRLAQEDLTLAQLQRALARTVRRLHALEQVVLPDMDLEIAAIESSLEEESRDEAFRVRRRREVLPAPGGGPDRERRMP
jgi:V/A-type H+-transporting ATPase subunit D